MFIRDGAVRGGRDVEKKVRTAKGPAAEDRGCAWAGSSRKVSVREGHAGRGLERKLLSDNCFSITILVHALQGEMLHKALGFQRMGPGLLSTANVTAIAG